MDTNFLGAHGGQLALAFGSGCVAGYGFCMRTIYKLLHERSSRDHDACMERIRNLEREKEALLFRMKEVEDRVYAGQLRQLEQIRQSSLTILSGDKLGKDYTKDENNGI